MDNYRKVVLVGVITLVVLMGLYSSTPWHRSTTGLVSFEVVVVVVALASVLWGLRLRSRIHK